MLLDRTRPISYATDAAVPTTGSDFIFPTTVNPRQVKVFVDGLAYVGFGDDDSPTAIAADSAVAYQEADTEVVYTLDNPASRGGYAYLWVYAVAGTVAARVSFYG